MRSFLLLSLAVPSLALASTRTVCPSGCDHTTIAGAITAASSGDVIEIADGTYNERVSVSNNLTLRAQNPAVLNTTTGQYEPSVILRPSTGGDILEQGGGHLTVEDIEFDGTLAACRGIDAATAADSLTLTRVYLHDMYRATKDGGAVNVNSGSASSFSLTLTDVWMEDNATDNSHSGGAVFLTSGTLSVTGGVFLGNRALHGGAIFARGADVTVTGSVFSENYTLSTNGYGGAISWAPSAASTESLDVSYSTFDQNHANRGGAISIFDTTARTGAGITLLGNAYCGNLADEHGGALLADNVTDTLSSSNSVWLRNTSNGDYGGGLIAYDLSEGSFSNDAFVGNTAGPSKGGSLSMRGVDLALDNTIVAYSYKSGDLPNQAIDLVAPATGAIDYSLFYGNSADVVNKDIATAVSDSMVTGTGNLSSAPDFLWDPTFLCSDYDPVQDLYLEAFAAVAPRTSASPMVDHGDPTCSDPYAFTSAPYTPYSGGLTCDIGPGGGPDADTELFEDGDGDTWPLYLDCDDGDADIYPGVSTGEVSGNNIDEDCDGSVACFVDSDGDGYGDAAAGVSLDVVDGGCAQVGYASSDEDCDDENAAINPDATEGIADGVDQDCDGGDLCYLDADGDTYGTTALTTVVSANMSCADAGESADHTDCDDDDGDIRPGVAEDPGDDVDQNCDGLEDCYVDADQDGAGHSSNVTTGLALTGGFTCDTPASFIANDNGDCDDGDELRYLGAPERCNGVSDACASTVPSDEQDGDGDSYVACEGWEGGSSLQSGDCDDSSALIHPGATETAADTIDQDCDGGDLCYLDADGDTYGAIAGTTVVSVNMSCADAGESANHTDCDDEDSNSHPSATERCDGLDNNCDGSVPSNEVDTDTD
ncbi:MAG: hypothetical protein JXX28_16420, partial [Deltaproteobacteria bacterium]|nr:hypothetical protein [Deltaproteobacteria bacterium]